MKALTKLSVLLFFFSVVSLTDVFAQNPYPNHSNCVRQMQQAGLWYFGVYAGMNFAGVDPVPETTQPDVLLSPISPGVIADSAGNLICWTNGKQVYNNEFHLVGDGLFGHFSCTQPAIIVPKPGDHTKYFIFTTDSYRNINGDNGLNYTVMTVDTWSGYANATSINNNLIENNMDGRLTAVKHANGEDYWVISHRWESNEFCAFRVNAAGVDQNYVSSNIGSVHSGANNLLGFMKASPDGSRLAVSLYESQIVEVFNFNTENGTVSSAQTSPPDYNGAYGLEFSQDNSKLYLTTLDYANIIPAFPSELIQFDLDAANIFASATSIHTSDNGFRYGALQLGLDGRIYLAKSINATDHSDSLGVIYNPNRQGLACNYNSLGGADLEFYLGGKQSFWGLPNIVQSFVDWPHFLYDSVCIGDLSIFSITNQANIDDAGWEFNDPAGTSNTTDFLNPTHLFSSPGQRAVAVTETYGGSSYTYSESVTVHPLPQVTFGVDTIYIFKGDYATLNVGQWAGYLWSTGSTASEITVADPGQYWVEVQNEKCCYNADTVYVVQYDLHVPNAFRPASPVNYEFKPVVPFNAVQDYSLKIFDRWGQLIFESKDLGVGWTGNINGQPAPVGVYAWRIDYNTISAEGTRPIKMAGTVMLLR